MSAALDRILFFAREKLGSADLNAISSQSVARWAEYVRRAYGNAGAADNGWTSVADPEGCIGGSFAVKATGGMVVAVNPGMAFLRTADGLDEATIHGASNARDVAYRAVELSAAVNFTIPAAPIGGQNRIDIVEIAPARSVSAETRSLWNVVDRIFRPASMNKNVSNDLVASTGSVIAPAVSTAGVSYKKGVAAAAGAEVQPPTTPGYHCVATILVEGGAATVAQTRVADHRRVLLPGGATAAAIDVQSWVNDLLVAPVLNGYVVPNGMRVAVAFDEATVAAGEASGRFFVAHGPWYQAIPSVSYGSAADTDITVRMNTVTVDQLSAAEAAVFNGLDSAWQCPTPAAIRFAPLQWGTKGTFKVKRAGGAFSTSPELYFTFAIGPNF